MRVVQGGGGPSGSGAASGSTGLASGATAARLRRIREEAGESLFADVANFPYPEVAAAWDPPDLGDAYRSPLVSDVRTLFVSGSLDWNTLPFQADEIAFDFNLIDNPLKEEKPQLFAAVIEQKRIAAIIAQLNQVEGADTPRSIDVGCDELVWVLQGLSAQNMLLDQDQVEGAYPVHGITIMLGNDRIIVAGTQALKPEASRNIRLVGHGLASR